LWLCIDWGLDYPQEETILVDHGFEDVPLRLSTAFHLLTSQCGFNS
jgi:hypothetical protein